MRLPPQLGHSPRPLQDSATSRSQRHALQRKRHNPCSMTPQVRKSLKASSTNRGTPPCSLACAKNEGKVRSTTWNSTLFRGSRRVYASRGLYSARSSLSSVLAVRGTRAAPRWSGQAAAVGFSRRYCPLSSTGAGVAWTAATPPREFSGRRGASPASASSTTANPHAQIARFNLAPPTPLDDQAIGASAGDLARTLDGDPSRPSWCAARATAS